MGFHQQNLSVTLCASGSIWELLDQNFRVIKSQSVLDRCSGHQVHLGAPANNPHGHRRSAGNQRSTGEAQQHVWEYLGVPQRAGDKIGSTDNKPRSTRECQQQTR